MQLKKDIDVEKAGLQFISYQELQATVCDSESDPSADAASEEDGGDEGNVERDRPEVEATPGCDDEEEEVSHLVENIKISDPRRGTEVKLLGLRLGDNTATVVAQRITVCLQCHRWRNLIIASVPPLRCKSRLLDLCCPQV